ncbi:MAG: carboxylesterase/lipase family protein [Novosphingobium sp.]|nr:carboxylesterase/lipase family protein [Novosphingobium sp.]
MKARLRAVAALGALGLLCANHGPVVSTDAGRVRGEAIGKGAAFRGIPFAAPPTGEMRWRDSVPVKRWRGVRDASAFGPACPQRDEGGREVLPQDEDCLSVNVITPDLKGRKLPVLVSIHGGAYAFGSNRHVTDQGLTPLLEKGVVLVAPNYRVGRLGFFAHPALTAEAGRGTGNFWLSDQVLALGWVRRNIAKFGGDPENVTILGCSAGGSSVNALMASPKARGLFAKASAHSGGGMFNANRPLASAEQQGIAFASRAGVEGSGSNALEHLRALSPEDVIAADPGAPDFGAIVDEYYLPAPLSVVFAHGEQARVPYISGSTSNEASVFGLMGFDAQVLRSRFGIDLDAMRPAYEARYGALEEAELIRRVQTDFLFTSAALGMAGLHSRVAPAWTYHFDYLPQGSRGSQPGAPHCADMPYLFGPVPDDDESRALAGTMRDLWFDFIGKSDPSGPAGQRWPAMRPGDRRTLLVSEALVPVRNFGGKTIDAWFAKWKAETSISIEP